MIQEKNNFDNEVNTEEINLNYFFTMLANTKEANEYITKLKKFINDYFLLFSTQYNRFNDLYHNFFSEKNNSIINTPIYKIVSKLKKILSIQLKFLESNVLDPEIFNSIQDQLSQFQTILKNLPSNINHFSLKEKTNNTGTTNIVNLLNKSLNDLEMKIIEEYVSKTYNKHISGVNTKDSINTLVNQIHYLENSLLNILKGRKTQYFDEIKGNDDIINKISNDLNITLGTHIKFLKDKFKFYYDELENLEKEMEPKEIKIEKNNKEEYILSRKEYVLEEQEINRFKYKIKTIKLDKIPLKEDQENKENKENENNIHKKEYEKNAFKYKETSIYLNEQDKYEIILKIYSYNFFIVDKSQYNLEQAKGKIEALNLSNKLLSYLEDGNEILNLLENNYNEIIQSINEKILNNISNIETFFITLNNFRGGGKNQFPPKLYDIMIYIYNKTLSFLLTNPNRELEDLIIILSQTYYKKIDGKKIYISEDIKSHEIFKKIDFWEANLIKKIEDEIKFKKKYQTNFSVNMKNNDDLIITKLIPFESVMMEFGIPIDKIIILLEHIFNKYSCSDNAKLQAISYLNMGINK